MISERWFRIAFWAALIVAFTAAIWPKPLQLLGEPSDKVQHILAFLVLTALALAAYRRTPFLYVIAGLALFGALIEVTQMIPALNRDAELLDWIADVTAVATVLAIAAIWRRVRGS